jgi:Holliday junction resolvase
MTINGRAKGKSGELELAKFLREKGWEARRGVQYSGGDTSQDLIHDIPGTHIECKRVEQGNPYLWLEQAIRDAAPGKTPIVMHRRNKQEWIGIMRLEDLLDLLALVHKGF